MPQTIAEDEPSFSPLGRALPPARAKIAAHVDRTAPARAAIPTHEVFAPRVGMATLYQGLGTAAQIQDELDEVAAHIRSFYIKSPDEVMQECSAYSARLTELCVLLHRVEALDRQYTRVRTMQVQAYLAEVDRQFKNASRQVEVNRQDIDLSGGQR